MTHLQTSYGDDTAGPVAGQIHNAERPGLFSRTADTCDIAFGRPVFVSALGNGFVSSSYNPGRFLGIAVAEEGVGASLPTASFLFDPTHPGLKPDLDVYPAGSTVSILRRGLIWVRAGSETTPGAQAYATDRTAITAIASGNEAIPAVFERAANPSEFVLLRVG